MKFYQDNRRNQSQPFSNDTFKMILSELLLGCVPDLDKFIADFHKHELFFFSGGDSISALKNGNGEQTDEISDYLIDIPVASFILHRLYLDTEDVHFKNQIDLRITELTNAIGPRTGEHIDKCY